jgi:hypothetical protein
MDDRTKEAFREIARQGDEKREVLHYMAPTCKCESCMAKRQAEIREKVLGQVPSNFHPELSPEL